jgi:signal transduction histidine kinase
MAWRRTPLWLRLITAVLTLSLLALTLTGIFGARLLRGYMVDRVDDQLRHAAEPFTGDGDVTGARPELVDALLRLLSEGTAGAGQTLPSEFHVALQDRGGQIVVELRSPLRADEAPPDLPEMTPAQAASRRGEPFTLSSTGRGGASWRALALPLDDASGTLVVASSLGDVDATVQRLVGIDMIVGAVVLVGLAVAGYLSVRTSLRPLTQIEETAAAIADGDLSRRVPHDTRTEVGRLGAALNAMLNQIETAFREREASEATARRSEEKMRRFVADASHELRTPLTSIRGFAELHRQGAVTEPAEVARLLRRIEDEATRMGLLVDDLLLLARVDQQRPFERAAVDLAVVAADAVEAARAVAPNREIRCETGDDGLVVTGDAARLRQVATNLVHNALAYTPEGSPVEVAVRRAEESTGSAWAVLEVSDQGPGLSDEQAEHVFERFYRTDAARTRAQGGTGLGLSIVAAITTAHGGRAEVDSAPGSGATFRVYLPLDGEDGDEAGV